MLGWVGKNRDSRPTSVNDCWSQSVINHFDHGEIYTTKRGRTDHHTSVNSMEASIDNYTEKNRTEFNCTHR